MKALRYHGKDDLRVENMPEPEITGAGQVKVAIDYCGICGTCLHEVKTGPVFIPSSTPHPLTGETAPLILGHEFAGRVLESTSSKVAVGDSVCIEPILFDRTCGPCKQGYFNLCDKGGFFGLSGMGGGFAERCVVTDNMVHKLPASISTKTGALVEPLAVAWHAVKLSTFAEGQTALIVGSGPIGLAVTLVLQCVGAAAIYVSDPAKERAALALEFGAAAVWNPLEDDVVACVKRLVPDGVDVAFDCSGRQVTLDTAIAATRHRGTIYNVAVWETQPQINMNALLLKEKRLLAGVTYDFGDYAQVIDAIQQGRLQADKLISGIVSLDQAIDKGFKELISNTAAHVKILVRP